MKEYLFISHALILSKIYCKAIFREAKVRVTFTHLHVAFFDELTDLDNDLQMTLTPHA